MFGMEAVFPIDVKIASLQVALERQISRIYWYNKNRHSVDIIDKKLQTAYHLQKY